MFKTVVSVGDSVEYFKDKAMLHVQSATLNPLGEDNYYQATASLPWEGLVEETQFVLNAASEARKKDPWPAFFQGFNEYYFKENAIR